ncbi:discoidin domain-containing protein [Cohnella laeviribosi]|uniref:discoidin domain-containing protein n=1 Tax=Cohnella laeviribosi TaxID=380174 RepID=UPI000376FE5D|nr:discoidin domain-containing protein [Cohnella laeviribosi]
MLATRPHSAGKRVALYFLALTLILTQLTILPSVSSAAVNLAAGKAITASSVQSPYVASNANDNNQATYWESANSAFPQWIRVDLGSSATIEQVVLKLPAGWEARTQTLSVQGSADDTTYTTLAASANYSFNPASGNMVTIGLTNATARYVKLVFTANTGWSAGQLSEFEVYGTSTPPPQTPEGTYEAETAVLSGGAKVNTDHAGYTGTGFVDGYWIQGASTAFSVQAASAGNYDVTLRYGNASGSAKTVSIYVNGVKIKQTTLPNLANWDTWSTKTETLALAAGSNTIAYKYDAGDSGNINLDNISVAPGSPDPTTPPDPEPPTGTNLALNKPISASSTIHTFVAANANDGNVTTYWEANANSYPNTLTVDLGANADLTSIVLKLNPDSIWATRTQTIQVLSRDQNATAFSELVPSSAYTFNPATGNFVTIPVHATASDVQLKITSNTGSTGGQIAEIEVYGSPAPNPDLTITGLSWSPSAPVETDAITLTSTVKNIGTAPSAPSTVNFYLGDALAGTANVSALAAGASGNVTVNIGAKDAGTYALSSKVDEANAVIELNENNNAFTNPSPLTISPVSSSDLIASAVSWTPSNPAAGNNVSFSVTIKNQGTSSSASGAHGITLTITDATTSSVVKTLTGSYNGVIASGATTSPVNLGTWTAANGKYNVNVQLAADANELPMKQGNNVSTLPLFVGRGANMPYDMYEAEDGRIGGGAAIVGPNRTIGDLAGEASGRKAVTLNTNGSYVEFTTKASTNTLVVRFSIPDSPSGDGINSTLNVYVNGSFAKAIPLTSKYAWLYGSESSPGNSPGAGSPRHIYDEANMMFDTTIPAGSTIRLQKDPANSTTYAIDFINLEQVAPIANPDPAKYVVPAGFTHQDVQNALDRVRMDTTSTLVGVYLPAGTYQTSSKFQVYGKPVKVVGAGPWYTRFVAPSNQTNTDIGFNVSSTANGSTFAHFAYFGNYTSRIDGPGKVFDFSNVSNMTIDDIWVEHQVCMYWGANTDYITIKNSRIRNLFADGINMTNGSTNNLVSNIEARATGDDSFALFSATDAGGTDNKDNIYENLTSILTWRAAGVAVYGGYANTFRNIYIADTLCYSGVTISSLDFGYPMNGFGASPPTKFENISIVRAGGHFWGAQTFPAMWLFSASKVFQGIRVNDVDIIDPTYHGIMFQTNYVGSAPQNPITDTIFTNITISGAKKSGDAFDAKSGFGIWANEMPEPGQGPAVGSVTFNNLKLINNAMDIRNITSTFTININP